MTKYCMKHIQMISKAWKYKAFRKDLEGNKTERDHKQVLLCLDGLWEDFPICVCMICRMP